MFINKADLVDEEMLELVEIEVAELLSEYGFNGDTTPMVKGSALLALNGNGNWINYTSTYFLPNLKLPFNYIQATKVSTAFPVLIV